MALNLKSRTEKRISKRFWIRILLSGFLCYHLIVIAVLANGASYLGRSLDSWISPYGNFFGFNVAWNFFAPDPAHTMYIEYFVHFEDESRDPVEGYIPPEKEKIVIDSSKRRFLYAMRFMIIDEKRLKVILGPYLCRQYPGASSVHIKNILEPIPNLDLSQVAMLEQQQALIMEHTYDCHATQDEVAL